MNYAHFLLTRYNIGLYSDRPYPQVTNPADWMTRRLPLFAKTVHSIEAQTVQLFRWLVILDPNTPAGQVANIKALLPPNAEVAYARRLDLQDLHTGRDGAMRNFGWPDVDFLVTSRVDNDDVLLPRYIEVIQENVYEAEEAIDVRGWRVDTLTGERRPPLWDGRPVSMFISLVEEKKPWKTVCFHQHPRLHQHYPARLIDERLWEIRVHDHNLKNREQT